MADHPKTQIQITRVHCTVCARAHQLPTCMNRLTGEPAAGAGGGRYGGFGVFSSGTVQLSSNGLCACAQEFPNKYPQTSVGDSATSANTPTTMSLYSRVTPVQTRSSSILKSMQMVLAILTISSSDAFFCTRSCKVVTSSLHAVHVTPLDGDLGSSTSRELVGAAAARRDCSTQEGRSVAARATAKHGQTKRVIAEECGDTLDEEKLGVPASLFLLVRWLARLY